MIFVLLPPRWGSSAAPPGRREPGLEEMKMDHLYSIGVYGRYGPHDGIVRHRMSASVLAHDRAEARQIAWEDLVARHHHPTRVTARRSAPAANPWPPSEEALTRYWCLDRSGIWSHRDIRTFLLPAQAPVSEEAPHA